MIFWCFLKLPEYAHSDTVDVLLWCAVMIIWCLCVSVCLSVTFMDSLETIKRILKNFLTSGS